MGSSNPLEKIGGGIEDAWNSVKEDPVDALTSAIMSMGTSGFSEVLQRTRDDQRDQAEGMAEKDQGRIDAATKAADARARDMAVKDLDPVALERRRRAQLRGANGRNSTILTDSSSLGTAELGQKTLLGL